MITIQRWKQSHVFETQDFWNVRYDCRTSTPIVVQCQDEKFPSCLNKQVDGQNNKAVNNSHLERKPEERWSTGLHSIKGWWRESIWLNLTTTLKRFWGVTQDEQSDSELELNSDLQQDDWRIRRKRRADQDQLFVQLIIVINLFWTSTANSE